MFLHEEKRSLNTESDGRNQPQQPRRRTIRPSPVAIRAGCVSEVCERGLLGKRKDGRQAEDVCPRWFGLLMGNRREWFKKIPPKFFLVCDFPSASPVLRTCQTGTPSLSDPCSHDSAE